MLYHKCRPTFQGVSLLFTMYKSFSTSSAVLLFRAAPAGVNSGKIGKTIRKKIYK